MDMKEKLVELINDCRAMDGYGIDLVEKQADYLLENIVIVLPCKVGDAIYRCGDQIKRVYEWEIEHIEIYVDGIVFIDDSDNAFTVDDIGKTVFLTRKEAEAALKVVADDD